MALNRRRFLTGMDQQGISILEIMVTLTMFSVVTMALLQTLDTLSKLQGGYNFDSSFRATSQSLGLLLNEPELCKNNFQGLNFAPPATSATTVPFSGAVALTGQSPLVQLDRETGRLKTTKFELSRLSAGSLPNTWIGRLHWEAQPAQVSSQFINKTRSQDFGLFVEVDAQGTLTGCSLDQSTEGLLAGTCTDLGGTMTNTTPPKCQFPTCPQNEFATSIKADGTVVCTSANTATNNALKSLGTCGPDQYLVGFKSDGSMLCSNKASATDPTTLPDGTTAPPPTPTKVCDKADLKPNYYTMTGYVWEGWGESVTCRTECSGGYKYKEAWYNCIDGKWASGNSQTTDDLSCIVPACGDGCKSQVLDAIVLGWCAPQPTIVPPGEDGARLSYNLCSCNDNCQSKLQVTLACGDGSWSPIEFSNQ